MDDNMMKITPTDRPARIDTALINSTVGKVQPPSAVTAKYPVSNKEVMNTKTVNDAVNKLNDIMSGADIQIKVVNNKAFVQVIDAQNSKVIRQIPNEEAVAIAKSIDRLTGLLINRKA